MKFITGSFYDAAGASRAVDEIIVDGGYPAARINIIMSPETQRRIGVGSLAALVARKMSNGEFHDARSALNGLHMPRHAAARLEDDIDAGAIIVGVDAVMRTGQRCTTCCMRTQPAASWRRFGYVASVSAFAPGSVR